MTNPSNDPNGWPEPTEAAVAALAPTGKLRAGINLSNFLLVSDHDADGNPVGVSPSMARQLAGLLEVPVELTTFANPGDVADAAADNVWDIGNIGADPARAQHINFSAPYAEIEATYLVRGDSAFSAIDEVDVEGVTVVTKARAAYTLWLERHIGAADIILSTSTDESFERFVAEDIDVLAGLRPRLTEDSARLTGSRILPGRFMAVQQAIGTPKGRPPAGIDYLERFVAHALASGHVAQLIDGHQAVGLLPAAD